MIIKNRHAFSNNFRKQSRDFRAYCNDLSKVIHFLRQTMKEIIFVDLRNTLSADACEVGFANNAKQEVFSLEVSGDGWGFLKKSFKR